MNSEGEYMMDATRIDNEEKSTDFNVKHDSLIQIYIYYFANNNINFSNNSCQSANLRTECVSIFVRGCKRTEKTHLQAPSTLTKPPFHVRLYPRMLNIQFSIARGDAASIYRGETTNVTSGILYRRPWRRLDLHGQRSRNTRARVGKTRAETA